MSDRSPYFSALLIPMHFFGVIAILTLLFSFSWWMLPAIFFSWFITGCIGTEIGLHRLYSHNAFEIKSKSMKWFMGLVSCMGGQWSPVFWAALHRGYHHPSSDTVRDIHSPIHGKWQAYMGWTYSLKHKDVNLGYAKDLLRDPMHRFLHKNYIEIFWAIILFFLLILRLKVFFIAVIIPILLAMHQENLINVVCHKTSLGYRNFDTNDKSTNIYLLGLLLWGQGFHNNHHAKPNRYDFGIKKGEIDICRWVVPALIWIDNKLVTK